MIESNDEGFQLPRGWICTTIGKVIKNIPLTGKKLKQSQYKNNGMLPVIDQGQNFIGGYTDKNELKVNVKMPVVIFGDHTKVLKFVDFDFVAGADGIKVLEPLEILNPRLFYYFLSAIKLPEKGYARHFQFLEKSLIRIPPLSEQRRIVAKMDELYSYLDIGVESLWKVKAQLKRYRQAVLKYAFEGKLTEEWRKTHKDQIKPIQKLLKSIKEKNGQVRENRTKSEIIDKYQPEALPENWVWSSIGKISELISGQHIMKNNYNQNQKGVPYLTGPEDFRLKYPLITKWTIKPKVIANYNDVLVTVKGAGVGKTNILNIKEAAISRQLMAIRSQIINSDYIYYFLQHVFSDLRKLGSGSTVPGIRREQILLFPIPLTIINEQDIIVKEIEARLSIVDEIEKITEQSLKQSERLRQSILKKAFEGGLTPQDPTDEPAERLLERIKEERKKYEIGIDDKSALRQVELVRFVK